jgi:shikimate 5-dehydrogenase
VGVVEDVEQVDLVVNATPLGMAGMAEAEIEPAPLGMAGAGAEPAPLGQLALPVERLRPGQVLVDLVYHPRRTPLVEAAAAQGVTAVGGLGMLVHQAAHSFRLWTGQSAPLDAMRSAVAGQAARHILPELGQDVVL